MDAWRKRWVNERNLPLESVVTLIVCDAGAKPRLSERKEKAISCFLHSRDEYKLVFPPEITNRAGNTRVGHELPEEKIEQDAEKSESDSDPELPAVVRSLPTTGNIAQPHKKRTGVEIVQSLSILVDRVHFW